MDFEKDSLQQLADNPHHPGGRGKQVLIIITANPISPVVVFSIILDRQQDVNQGLRKNNNQHIIEEGWASHPLKCLLTHAQGVVELF